MFMNADNLVKAVMVGLAFASVVSWTIALAKWLELAAFKVRLGKTHRAIAEARSLADAQNRVGQSGSAAAGLVRAAVLELEKSPDRSDREGIRERLAATIERIEASVGRRLGRGTGILGTIGATAPFVGLFGTVWGIMKLHRDFEGAHHQPRRGRPRHCRSLAGDGARACRGHPGGRDLQLPRALHRRLQGAVRQHQHRGAQSHQPRDRATS
jgi:biopolymer transport protein ExbB/TolQ